MDILVDFAASGGPRVSIVGTMDQAQLVQAKGPVDMLGIRFRPGALLSLCKTLDAAPLVNAHAALSDFWGNQAGEFAERLAEAPAGRRIGLLRETLGRRDGSKTEPDPYVAHCAARLQEAAGCVTLSSLERSTGLSARQLERKFSRQVGVSPKTFGRLMRFRRLVRALESSPSKDWAGLAARFGYADQPHLAREFRQFSGLSPSAYWTEELERD